ncbi:tungsten ABC transporter substrate-binding protein [Methylobacterium indicum]|uniref:Tungsten ABC transporter substrate-binding protein n=1 Tax=Methylobacterium indicum TaxID=1775910 RepID=A0A8H8WYD1_9HYPH|nr:tungsten ABC transporter substrate-binding protein [Methylobacterium indicum]
MIPRARIVLAPRPGRGLSLADTATGDPPLSLPISRRLALAALLALAPVLPATAQERAITLASTTSTEQSGLFGHLLPIFQRETGIAVRVVAVGTGQALAIGAKGDADALLVHDRAGEDKFVADGHGLDRRDVMANDFVIVGPAADPAGIKGGRDATDALARIAKAKAPFASRGDDSGTNRTELRLWKKAGIEARGLGSGYRELGQGMGPTLNAAAAMDAYTLTDRATWANFKNRQNLVILVQGDPALFNPYGSILVNPSKNPQIHAADAKIWHEWLTSERGRAAIASFTINGEQLFFPTGTMPTQ